MKKKSSHSAVIYTPVRWTGNNSFLRVASHNGPVMTMLVAQGDRVADGALSRDKRRQLFRVTLMVLDSETLHNSTMATAAVANFQVCDKNLTF